jgi:hypothetical protein
MTSLVWLKSANSQSLLYKNSHIGIFSELVHKSIRKWEGFEGKKSPPPPVCTFFLFRPIHPFPSTHFSLTPLKKLGHLGDIYLSSHLFISFFSVSCIFSFYFPSFFFSLELYNIISLDYGFYSSFLNINLRPS